MFKINDNKKIKLFLDGPDLELIKLNSNSLVDGYTFNPTLFRKLGVKNYINFCHEILLIEKNKPISFEVLSDTENKMIDEAIAISDLSNNSWVKIPITFTNGQSTINVINKIKDHVKLNITAIFTIDQIKTILDDISSTKSILSIFGGRLYDIGVDAAKIIRKVSEYVHQNSNCELLWASPRMSYDIISAIECGCDIITMPNNLIKKLELFNLSPDEYSLQTVKMFYNDAIRSNYKII